MGVTPEPLEPPSKRRRMGSPPQEGGNVVLAEPAHPPRDPLPPAKHSTSEEPNDEVMEGPHPPLIDPDPPLQRPDSPLETEAEPLPAALVADGGEPPLDVLPEAPDIAALYRQHWPTIRQHVHRGGAVQDRYNFRLTGERVLDRFVHSVYDDQTTAFKVNFAYRLILRHRETHQVRYYYPTLNNARVLPTPHLLQNRATLTALLEENTSYKTHDAMTWGRLHRPDTKRFVEQVTNVLFYVNKLPELMIGAPATVKP